MLDTTKTDSIGELIVSVKYFDSLKLETWKMSNADSVYVIKGKIKDSKMKDYADGTEKAIGKGIIFLYNGDIICTPVPNYRIDGGRFAISSNRLVSERETILEIYESLKAEIE